MIRDKVSSKTALALLSSLPDPDGIRKISRLLGLCVPVLVRCRVRDEEVEERVGFEPTVPSLAQRFSRPSQSTTLAPLLRGGPLGLAAIATLVEGGAYRRGGAGLPSSMSGCSVIIPSQGLHAARSVPILAVGLPRAAGRDTGLNA